MLLKFKSLDGKGSEVECSPIKAPPQSWIFKTDRCVFAVSPDDAFCKEMLSDLPRRKHLPDVSRIGTTEGGKKVFRMPLYRPCLDTALMSKVRGALPGHAGAVDFKLI
jgi:hypothetical protein